jgi:hypothetical protein
MATLAEKIKCEQAAREMLEGGGLPPPDRVEYGHTCIRLFWEEPKLALVVDIDEPPEGFEVVGEYLDDLDLDEGEDDDDFEDEDVAEILRRLDHDDDDQEEEAA